jgi:hypothetical protein
MALTGGQINGLVNAAGTVVGTAESAGKGASESTGGAMGKGALTGAATGATIGSVVPVIGTAIGAVGGAIIGGLFGLFSNNSKKKKEQQALDAIQAQKDYATAFGVIKGTNDTMFSIAKIANGGFWDKFHAVVAADQVAEANAETVQNVAPYGVYLSVAVLVAVFGYKYLFNNKKKKSYGL